MRGDDGDNIALETCRIAFQERKPDARQRAVQALARAKRVGNEDEARALAEVLAGNRNRRLAVDDIGPTAETLVQCRRGNHVDTVTALAARRKLAYHQQAAALQISDVFQALTGSLSARGACWERGRIDGACGSGGPPEKLAALYHRRFLPWARWMASPRSLFQICLRCDRRHVIPRRVDACDCGSRRLWRSPPHLPLTLSIVVFGAGLQQVADTYRMRRPRALRLLRAGLDRYADFS